MNFVTNLSSNQSLPTLTAVSLSRPLHSRRRNRRSANPSLKSTIGSGCSPTRQTATATQSDSKKSMARPRRFGQDPQVPCLLTSATHPSAPTVRVSPKFPTPAASTRRFQQSSGGFARAASAYSSSILHLRSIKRLNPASKRVQTLVGTGRAGFKDGQALLAQLSEPSGIVEAQNGRFYIADTNNSVIRYMDLSKEPAKVYTLELKGVQPPTSNPKSLKRLRKRSSADTDTIMVDGRSSSEGNLYLTISVAECYHFSKEARSKFSVEVDPEDQVVIDPLDGYLNSDGSATLKFQRSSLSSSTSKINCKVYYCKEDEICLYQSIAFVVAFQEVTPESAPAEIKLEYLVKPKTPTSGAMLPLVGLMQR